MNLKEKQIIYIDNKPHIKCDIVMLPTKNESSLWVNCENKLKIHIKDRMCPGKQEFQHLYVTSDEEIKSGDYFLTNQNNYWELQKCQKVCEDGIIMSFEEEIAMFQEDTYFVFNPENCKKIIVTTDTSLGLPQPSQQFIEKYIEEYNKNNQITEVLVEVEEYEYIWKEWFQEAPYIHKSKEWRLKLDSQNQITIRKQKDSWSREEVIKLLDKFAYDVAGNGMLITAQLKANELWIEKNL